MRARTIAVTGAAGRIGGHVVKLLAAEGHRVVAVTRRPVDRPIGGEVRLADYEDPGALRMAVRGADTAVLITSDGEVDLVLQHHLNLIDAMTANGVGHVVLLSSVDADPTSPFCYARVNALTERALRRSGLPHTFLRASIYTEFLAALCTDTATEGIVRLPAAEGRIGLVARADVARCLAAQALLESHHDPIRVTGPQSLGVADVASVMGMRYQPVDETAFLASSAGRETAWWTYAYTSLLASVRDGRWDLVTDDVNRLTSGRALAVSATLRGVS